MFFNRSLSAQDVLFAKFGANTICNSSINDIPQYEARQASNMGLNGIKLNFHELHWCFNHNIITNYL